MRNLIVLIARFRSDERGAFAMIFAVISIVLIAMSGAVVDFTSMQGTRTRAQIALDSAALALQPTIYTGATTASIKLKAQNLLIEQINDPSVTATISDVSMDTVQGQLSLTANVVVPMNFVSLVGVNSLTAQVVSVATRKKLNLEVAMVLDNSGSMSTSMGSGKSRMDNLHTDATCAANILFYGVKDCTTKTTGMTVLPNVKIGLVPFNAMVNVGTSNSSKFWLDRKGGSNTFPNDNFDSDDNPSTPYTATTDRIALFSQLSYKGSKLAWGGCVEARKQPYDTDDTTPVAGSSDTLFTPLFAPDEPDDGYSNDYLTDLASTCNNKTPVVVWTEVKSNCDKDGATQSGRYYSSASCSKNPTETYTETDTSGKVTQLSSLPDNIGVFLVPDDSSQDKYTSVKNKNGTYTNTRASTYNYVFPDRVLQERLCKYTGASLTTKPNASSGIGPNSQCTTTSITPLSDDPPTVVTAIGNMQPIGNTNIQEGAAWGFRVLSPTEPFTDGLPYDAATSKVMIIMTDGENTFDASSNMNGASLYSAYGYPYNNGNLARGRMGTVGWNSGQYEDEINSRLSTTCTNAKALGITIYTIGLATKDTSDPDGNIKLLTDCATDSAKAFFPTTTAELASAFLKIANELSDLRIER